MRLALAGLVALAVLGGCSDDEPVADPTPSPLASPSSSTSEGETVTAAPDPGVDELVVPAAADLFPQEWREVFVVPYGPDEAQLGTSPGGESGTLDIGPDYGAQGPGGDWWFLDAAKRRLAHYDAAGTYRGDVSVPKRLLVGRTYFQWQLPFVMADNTLVAVRHAEGGAYLLRLHDGVLDETPVDRDFSPMFANDLLLYGFALDGSQVVVDPDDGAMASATVFTTAARTPFRLTKTKKGLRIELPEVDVDRVLPIVTASGAPAHIGLQVRAGADDVLHVFMSGLGEDDESVQLVGYTSISADGTVARVEGLPNPFSEADPGSPAQLVVAPGSESPMLVYVLEDGVHVYEKVD